MSTDMNHKIANHKIAVIGPTQSGKTCLAVGLFSTNTSGFTIESVEEDGRAYLSDLKIALRPQKDEQGNIRPGVWPEASNLGTDKELRFDFLKKGKDPIRVELPEYSGEMLRPEKFVKWANAHLRGLSGVVLLINPGAEAFQSGDQSILEDYMAQYDNVITYLRDPANNSNEALVALTVTAADRIAGDLKGKLDSFNERITELSNTLGASGFKWERFNVTITGHLKDQKDPTLAKGRQNSASRPFLWLLDKLHWLLIRQKIFRKVRNCILAIAGLAVLCGIGFGVHAWNVSESIDNEKARLEEAIRNCKNRGDLEIIRDMLVALQGRSGLFAGKARSLAADLELMAWNVFEAQINKEMNTIRGDPERYGSTKDCNRVDSIFACWTPQSAECQKKRLTLETQWKEDKPVWQDRYAIAQMNESVGKEIEKLTATHGEDVVKSLYVLYGKMKNLNPCSAKTQKRKEELLKSLDERVAKEFREHLMLEFNNNRNPTKERIDEQVKRLGGLLSDWEPHGDDYRKTKEEIDGQLKSDATTKTKDWDSQKRTECQNWIKREIESRPNRKGHELIRAYIREKRNHRDHEEIFNETIRRAVYLHCERCFVEDIAFFKKNIDYKSECKERFNDYFKNLCKAIVEDAKDDPDEVSWAIRFAKGCVDVGKVQDGFENAFPQEFAVTEIKGWYSGTTPWKRFQGLQIGVETDKVWFTKSNDDDESKRINGEYSERLLWKGNLNIKSYQFSPPPEFIMSVLAVCKYNNERLEDGGFQKFKKEIESFDRNPVENGKFEMWKLFNWENCAMTVHVDIYMNRSSGKTIGELYDEARGKSR